MLELRFHNQPLQTSLNLLICTRLWLHLPGLIMYYFHRSFLNQWVHCLDLKDIVDRGLVTITMRGRKEINLSHLLCQILYITRVVIHGLEQDKGASMHQLDLPQCLLQIGPQLLKYHIGRIIQHLPELNLEVDQLLKNILRNRIILATEHLLVLIMKTNQLQHILTKFQVWGLDKITLIFLAIHNSTSWMGLLIINRNKEASSIRNKILLSNLSKTPQDNFNLKHLKIAILQLLTIRKRHHLIVRLYLSCQWSLIFKMTLYSVSKAK